MWPWPASGAQSRKPGARSGHSCPVVRKFSRVRSRLRRSLLFCDSALIFLIASVNVASLLAARAVEESRRRGPDRLGRLASSGGSRVDGAQPAPGRRGLRYWSGPGRGARAGTGRLGARAHRSAFRGWYRPQFDRRRLAPVSCRLGRLWVAHGAEIGRPRKALPPARPSTPSSGRCGSGASNPGWPARAHHGEQGRGPCLPESEGAETGDATS